MKASDNFIEKRTVNTVRDFKGINNSPSARDGDIIEAYNISTENYPAVSSCIPHLLETSFEGDSSTTVGCLDKPFYTAGGKFIYDNALKGSVDYGKKKFCTVNGCACIFPDKKYYINRTAIYRAYQNKMLECDTSEQYDNVTDLVAISDEAPAAADEGEVYYDTAFEYLYVYTNGEWVKSGRPNAFQRFRAKVEEFGTMDVEYTWKETANAQYRMECLDNNENVRFLFLKSSEAYDQDFKGIKAGDVVTITGVKINSSTQQDLDRGFSEGTEVVEVGDCYITVKNTAGATLNGLQASEVMKIKRFVPSLTCVTKVGNRLWGAHGQTIYASAENDPCVWARKDGISDRTITINTGISDNIIACAELGDVPVFFTEKSIIKVLRVYDGYKLSITPAISVSPENTDSIALVSDALYYASSCGIMCYKGTTPVKVDSNIGLCYQNIVGGSDGVRYFASDSKNTYIYDTNTKLWSAVNGGFYSFARCGSALLAAGKYYSGAAIFRIVSQKENVSSELAYYPGNTQIIFAPFYESTHHKKTFSKLIIGTCTERSTITDVYVSFDGGQYVLAGCIRGKEGVCVSELALIPVRADYMQVKIISHSGKFDLLSLSREFVTHENYN